MTDLIGGKVFCPNIFCVKHLFFIKLTIVGIWLCLTSAAVSADSAQPSMPDPAALSSDWWSYFEPEEGLKAEELRQRVEDTKLRLNGLKKTIATNNKTTYATLISQIDTQLDKLVKLKSTVAPLEKPLKTPQDVYSLKEALSRFNAYYKLRQDYAASNEDIAWRNAVIAEERKQQTRRRGQYLDMDKNDPQRLSKGLELMSSRIKLELQRIELNRQESLQSSVASQLDNQRVEMQLIPQRLQDSMEQLGEWQKEFESAQKKISEITTQQDQSSGTELELTQPELEMINARYTALLGVQKEAQTAVLTLKAMQANLAQQIIKLLNQPEKTNAGEVRQLLSNFDVLNDEMETKSSAWGKAARRLQIYAAGISEEKTKENAAAIALRQKALSLSNSVEDIVVTLGQEKADAGYFANLLSEKLQATEGWLKRGVTDTSHAAKRTWQVIVLWLETSLFEINDVPVTVLGLLRVVLILIIAWWLSKGIRKGLQRIAARRSVVSKSSLYTLERIIHYIILILGVIIGLSSIGIDFTKLALFASALGVGIGFGLQTLISNFVSGLIILFEKSLKVGDFVELASGVTGEVREINMRSTLITTNDNVDIVVPNSEFVAGRVTNWTLREAYRRIHVPFGVAYGTDKDLVKKAILEAAEDVQWTLKGKKGRIPQVWFVQFGDSSLNFELVVWLTPEAVKRPSAVQAEYLWEIESKLKKYAIEIPFPQRDLHLRSAFGKKDEAGLELLTASAVIKQS